MRKIIRILCIVTFVSLIDINIASPIRTDLQPNYTILTISKVKAQTRRKYKKPKRSKRPQVVDTSVPVPGSLIILASLLGGGGVFVFLRRKYGKQAK